MQMHVQALYVHNEQSRIVSVNAWHGGVAPSFFLGRTEKGHLWRFRYDLPEDICEELKLRCEAEPLTTLERPKYEDEYIRILSAYAPINRIWLGPAYGFPASATAAREPILIDEQNAYLLQGGLQDWTPDVQYQQPFVAMVIGGQAVAVCTSVRITDAAHEAGVETLAPHRRRGYAVSVVSAWASAVEKMGALPLYSTSTDNLPSQQVAARLGLSRYGIDFHIT